MNEQPPDDHFDGIYPDDAQGGKPTPHEPSQEEIDMYNESYAEPMEEDNPFANLRPTPVPPEHREELEAVLRKIHEHVNAGEELARDVDENENEEIAGLCESIAVLLRMVLKFRHGIDPNQEQ